MATDTALSPYHGSEIRTLCTTTDRGALHSGSESVKLAGVKEVLYHPELPTLRRMDMDTVAHKLPDKHCRTTTACSPDDFQNASFSLVGNRERRILSLGITETGRELSAKLRSEAVGPLPRLAVPSYNPLHNGPDWSQVIAEHGGFMFPPMDKAELRVTDYGVRYVIPKPPQSWRYQLIQEPSLDRFGQTPVPYNGINRHRTSGSITRYTSYLKP